MNIEKVKNVILLSKGKIFNFRFNGTRNKIEEFRGMIIDTFPSIFIVKVVNNDILKSFSYSDVLIHRLIIKENEK